MGSKDKETLRKALLSLHDEKKPWTLEDYVVKCLGEGQKKPTLWEKVKEFLFHYSWK